MVCFYSVAADFHVFLRLLGGVAVHGDAAETPQLPVRRHLGKGKRMDDPHVCPNRGERVHRPETILCHRVESSEPV